MPEIARLNGVKISMYFSDCEHDPPHIHVICGGVAAAFAIDSGNLLWGFTSLSERRLIKGWILQHKGELLEMWKTQAFKKIEGC